MPIPSLCALQGEGIGIASRVAATLPPDAAGELTRTANDAFLDAITRGFTISTAVLLAALVVAVTMIPRWMRPAQAEAVDLDDLDDELATHELQSELAG